MRTPGKLPLMLVLLAIHLAVATPPPGTEAWVAHETAHLTVHFPPASAVADPADFAADHERALAALLGELGGPLSGKVDVYVWNDDAQATGALGRPLAFAIPGERVVHTGPGHTLGHELAHVVVGDVVRPVQQRRFIGEGTAVAFDQSGRDLLAAARAAVRRTGARSISVLALWEVENADEAVLYPVAGAFVQRLIATGGKERFLKLLRDQTPESARAIYGAEFDAMVKRFEDDLAEDPVADAVAAQRVAAKARMAKDRDAFTSDELRAIEALYQRGSMKTAEGRAAYEELVRTWPKSNRAGCAQLYLARTARGAEREAALKRAFTEFDDTWYGDGTQVGPYARALLAIDYAEAGRTEEARALADEVATRSPDAVEHQGRSLVAALRAKGLLGP